MYLLSEKLQAKISGVDPDADARQAEVADEEEVEAAAPPVLA